MSEKLERVVAEAQLRPGLLVEMRNCDTCGTTERRLVTSREAHPLPAAPHPGSNCRGVKFSNHCCGLAFQWVCVCASIENAKLWLVNPFEDSETSTPVKRVRERTR